MPIRLLVIVVLTAVLRAQQPAPPASSTLTKYDRGATLAMLKQVKADLKQNYYDPSFRGLDVEKTFSEAEDRLESATSLNQAIGTIADVLMRLDDSHTFFLPPDRKARVKYGWQCAMVGDVPYVVAVEARSDAEKQGLKVGDRVLAWNQYTPTRGNLGRISYVYRYVRPQPLQHLVVRSADGALKTLDVETRLEDRDQGELPDFLRTVFDLFDHTDDKDVRVDDVYVWKYSGFGDPKDVERVLKKARTANALVLDLRGNSGGVMDAARAMVSGLFDRDVRIGLEHSRKGDHPIDAKGRKDGFAGRLVVLVDSNSASSAEILARLVQIERRGTVIGDRTAGAVMTARFVPHTYGEDRVTFYATFISVGELRLPDGASLERVGVTPDELVLPTGADLAASRDPVLARAMTMLGTPMTAEEAAAIYR